MMLSIRKTLCAATFLLGASMVQADPVSPESIPGAKTVDVTQAKALFENEALFVDVRKNSDWEAGRIPGALHLELKKVFNQGALSDEAEKDEEVVFYCNGPKCLRSAKATEQALTWGYSKVYFFREGFPSWVSAGMPVE